MMQRVLLGCGVISSLLYLATDILGGVRYEGYSFTSQAISELMAINAPSERFVDPLFIAYGVLVLAFGAGVLREGAHRSRALRTTGALLIGYATVGFAGPTLFEMHQRGAGTPHGDAPHMILTGVLVLLTLLAIGFGAFALDRKFRIYSLGTILLMIALGTMAVPYGARLAAGQPTPGLGIVERANVYTALLWVAVLASLLLRRSSIRGTAGVGATTTRRIDGFVASGFEEVRAEFERNFAERCEIGAAVATYWRGEKVVDFRGGPDTPGFDARWAEDTMIAVVSTAKSLAAMALAVANARGWLDYDAPVVRYSPTFAQNRKGAISWSARDAVYIVPECRRIAFCAAGAVSGYPTARQRDPGL
jgi:hypothetical membrane protein